MIPPPNGQLTERDGLVLSRVKYVAGAWSLLCLLGMIPGRRDESWDSPVDSVDILQDVQEVTTALLLGTSHPILERFNADVGRSQPVPDKSVNLSIALIETGEGKGFLRISRGIR